MLAVDWRWMFGIMGLAGVAGAIAWILRYRDPAAKRLTAEENLYRPKVQMRSCLDSFYL